MSYDLMVFDAKVAPRERAAFLQWYEAQVAWAEGYDYNDPKAPAAELRGWFQEMIQNYPPMNGPLAVSNVDDAKTTDYSLGTAVIYGAFAWSVAAEARADVMRLAGKHGVGFFDLSSDQGQVWIPDGKGGLVGLVEGLKLAGGIRLNSRKIFGRE